MRETRFWTLTAVIAVTLFGVLVVVLRGMEKSAVESVRAGMTTPEKSRDVVPVLAQTLRALKVVTVEVRTSVRTESADESWRGDVSASVLAPVVLYYGVDLAGLGAEDLRRNPLTGEITVVLPPPVRLATEVLGGDERAEVQVSGLRLRDIAGEYHLGRARIRLYERARALVLSPEERVRLEQTTREQMTRLVRAILGQNAAVAVEFDRREVTAGAGHEP